MNGKILASTLAILLAGAGVAHAQQEVRIGAQASMRTFLILRAPPAET